jgi:hypothetical protein
MHRHNSIGQRARSASVLVASEIIVASTWTRCGTARSLAVLHCVYGVVIAPRRRSLDIFFDRYDQACCGFNQVWREKRKASGIGPVLAMNGSEMRTTRRFESPGQNCRPENINRDLLSNPTQVQCNDELAETLLAAVIQIRCQEESL